MKLKDAIDQLGGLLKEAGLKPTLDPAANIKLPCFMCSTKATPRTLVVVGKWSRFMGCMGNVGGPIRRPMCQGCARATAPPPKLTKGDVAKFYNETFLAKVREKYIALDGADAPILEVLVPIKASHLDMRKVHACPDSPTKFCVYDWSGSDEACIFCEQPEERK
jgi:hypothetical protein